MHHANAVMRYLSYTYRQKWGNSKLVLNIKIVSYQNIRKSSLISLFNFIRIEYQCNWTDVLRNEC